MADETYLTPAELSERWGGRIKVKTLANWRQNGQGPAFQKFGRSVSYPLSAVTDYEKARRFTETQKKEAQL